jgi:hypothetical protein
MPAILSIGELLDLGNSAATAGLIPYSALEYNGSGDISGISGSAIAGGVDSAVVSSIVSSYVESGISGKADQSALEECCSAMSSVVSGKADQSALEDCCSAMSSVVSSKIDASASSLFQPSGDYYSASNPSGFITGVDLSEYQEKSGMTAYQPAGEYYSASNPSGFITGVDLSDYAKESSLSSKLDASASSQFQPSGDYVYESSYSSFSGDVVNNISSMSSIVSGLTGDYLEKSASSMFAPSGDYALSSDVSGVIDTVSSNSASWGQGGANYSGISPVIVDNDERTIGVSSTPLDVDGTMTSYVSGGITYFGVNESALNISSKLDATASSLFQPSGNYAYQSALSGKQDKLTWQYKTYSGSSFITSVNYSAFSAGFPTAVMLADTGLKLTISGNSAIMSLDTEGSVGKITGIGGSGFQTWYLSNMSTGSLTATNTASTNSYRWKLTDTTQQTGIVSRQIRHYNTVLSSCSGTGSSTGYSSIGVNVPGYGWVTAYLPLKPAISDLPSVVYPSSIYYKYESGEGIIDAEALGANQTAYIVSAIDSTILTATVIGTYNLGDVLPMDCGVIVQGQWAGEYLYNPSGSATRFAEYDVVEPSAHVMVAYVPSGSYLSAVEDTIQLVGLSQNYCTLNNFRLASSFSATAQSMVVPLTADQQVPTGSRSHEVHWTGVVDSPYNAKWYLVEGIAWGTPEVVAFDYTHSGTSVVRLDGITYGHGNNNACSGLSASAVFDSVPNNEQITILDQHGEYHKVTVGSLFGG